MIDPTVFQIIISMETTTDLAAKYGMTYREVQAIRRDPKYKGYWHLRSKLNQKVRNFN